MTMRTIGSFLLTSAIVAAATSASACPNCKRGYVFGKPVAVGNGMAFTWAKLGAGPNKVEAMGITFTETSLEGLPELTKEMPMASYVLEVPKEIKGKPYDHVGLDWNPKGHPPMPLYGQPHFDIHFYTISEATRAGITAKGADLKKCQNKPGAKFIPAGYILPPDTIVPTMGAHWIDPKSGEFNGKEFDTTFLFGTYNGKLAFIEPMITTKFLASKPDFHQALPVPQAVDVTGFYPSSYSVKYNENRKEITVSLEGLKYAEAVKPTMAKVAKKK
jgi:hypothetical protein